MEPGLRSRVKIGTLLLWEPAGKIGPVLKGHADAVRSAAWSPDGLRLASGGVDGTVRIWEADGRPGPILKGDGADVNSVAWSPKAIGSPPAAWAARSGSGMPTPPSRNR